MKYTYKNNSDQKQIVPNAGEVSPGGTIVTGFVVENPNFELVNKEQEENEKMVGNDPASKNPLNRKA